MGQPREEGYYTPAEVAQKPKVSLHTIKEYLLRGQLRTSTGTCHDPFDTGDPLQVQLDDESAKYSHESFDEWWDAGGMRPIRIPLMTPTQREQLDRRYRTTKAPRLRTRAQMIWLAAEHGLTVPQIAAIVRESEATVWRWLTR